MLLFLGGSVRPGFAGGSVRPAPPSKTRIEMMANLFETAKDLQGPEILWGPDGKRMGFEESDIRGYDSFTRFCKAVEEHGLTDELISGEFTILCPTDSAFESYDKKGGGQLTADILKYHMIPGRKLLDSLTCDQPTAQGGTLKYAARALLVQSGRREPSSDPNCPADPQSTIP